MKEALADDLFLQGENLDPLQDMVVTNTEAGTGDVMSLAVVTIIVDEGTAVTRQIATNAERGGTVKNQMVFTPTITDDESLVTPVEGVGMGVEMRKI